MHRFDCIVEMLVFNTILYNYMQYFHWLSVDGPKVAKLGGTMLPQ